MKDQFFHQIVLFLLFGVILGLVITIRDIHVCNQKLDALTDIYIEAIEVNTYELD